IVPLHPAWFRNYVPSHCVRFDLLYGRHGSAQTGTRQTLTMIQIDTERVLKTLRSLAQFGARGSGVCRPAFSVDDLVSRRWLADQLREAGLDGHSDSGGNVYGRSTGVNHAILVGSHSDSVPTGGWLDGSLGVVFGIEAARALKEQCPDLPVGIDVVSFSDEEG